MSWGRLGRFAGIFVGIWVVSLVAAWAAGIVPASLFGDRAFVVFNVVLAIVLAAFMYVLLTSVTRLRSNSGTDIGVRVREAVAAMERAVGLVEELQAELAVKTAALERIQADSAEFEKLAQVRKSEAEAVTRLVESVIATAHARLGRRNMFNQVMFFALGMLTAVPLGLLANYLSK